MEWREEMGPLFSLKYEDPRYLGYICAIDWDFSFERGIWSRSMGLIEKLFSYEFVPPCCEYTPVPGLDYLAFLTLLNRFGLLEWKEEIPIEGREVNLRRVYSFRFFRNTIEIIDEGKIIILRMNPAELIAKRREKEKLYGLPRLGVTNDNLDIDYTKEMGKRIISHYAEEYD